MVPSAACHVRREALVVAVTATPATEPDGGRVVRLLRQLAALTSDPVGAQRVAWTETWHRAREFLVSQLDGVPAGITTDPAGNLWARLPGQRADTVVLGSHVDDHPRLGVRLHVEDRQP